MFIELTNYESGTKMLVDPRSFIFVAPVSTLSLATGKSPNAVLMQPVLNPTVGIAIKEDYTLVKKLVGVQNAE